MQIDQITWSQRDAVQIIDCLARALGVSAETVVSRWNGDHRSFKLWASNHRTMNIKTIGKYVHRASRMWPEDVPWPEHIPRPTDDSDAGTPAAPLSNGSDPR